MNEHLCPICNAPMQADIIESPNVNPGGKTDVWHCENPRCLDSLKEKGGFYIDENIANPFLIRYANPKDANQGYTEVYVGSTKAKPLARYHYCPFCDNQVELLDSVYYIWNCPNCLLVRSGGLIERYYPIMEDGTADLDNEVISQRRGVPLWDPFAPLENEEDEGEQE